jgi:RNA polymerase-binding transcription factor DksA
MINEIHQEDATTSRRDVWHLLHWEREALCEALLRNDAANSLVNAEKRSFAAEQGMQARLRLIDDALDRLMMGTYGDCVKCGKWIEDTKLHLDPAFPFCHACEPQRLAVNVERSVLSDHEVIAW